MLPMTMGRSAMDQGGIALTKDTLFGGKLVIYQEQRGYRFSLDAVILAHLADATSRDSVVDLGTGCGIIPLILAYRRKARHIVGVEIQERLAAIARRNVLENGFDHLVEVYHLDMRLIPHHFPPSSFDVVVTNPPYRRIRSGRINPDTQKAIARHEVLASLGDVCSAASYLLKHGGRLSLIYPARRLDELIIEAARWHLRPKVITCIHSHRGGRAELVFLLLRKAVGQELTISPPLVVYEEEGRGYTPQIHALYAD